MYNLSELAITLNEPDETVAPTDSRNRPDQRMMEEGRWDEANAEKLRLEEKQRAKRRKREAEAAAAAESGERAKRRNYGINLGFSSKNFVHEWACLTSKFWLLLYVFLSLLTTHHYTSFIQNTQFCSKLVAFYHNLLKIHPIYVNWAPSFDKNNSITIPSTNSRKSTPQGRHMYVYHVNVRIPLPLNKYATHT